MSNIDKDLINDTFPGRNEGDRIRVNIGKIYEVRYANKLKRMYTKVKIDETDEDDVAIDASGYTGIFHRHLDEKSLEPFTLDQLTKLIFKNSKMLDIMRSIKDIDKEHNGYVTSTELDDILKIYYKELETKSLKQIFRPFSSIQNKILIDYKKFRDSILEKIKQYQDEETNDKKKKLNLLN